MDDDTTDELQEALRPIASLISKSEKAQQKLAPGTWQHRMLQDNLQALRLASALLRKRPDEPTRFSRADLEAALGALESMIGRTDKARAAFAPGTSQYTLQHNRLKALQLAEARVQDELKKD